MEIPEIIKEHSRSLLLFLVPTIVITIILFAVLGATLILILGFIVLLMWATFMYYFGVNRSLKNKELDKISLIVFVVATVIVSIFVFAMEDLASLGTYISIAGLCVLMAMFIRSFYSEMKEVSK